jgi:hypothetical protein
MPFLCEKDEASAGRRFVPFRLFSSNGTAPFTTGSNNTMLASLNGAAQISIGSVSVVSANAGMYGFQLTQSNCSTLGSMALYTDNVANYPQHVATVQFVANNPMSIQSGVIIAGGSYSSTTVRLDLVAYSGATVGAGNFAPGVYSGVSFSVRDSGIATTSFQLGSYSGVSVEIKTGGIQTASYRERCVFWCVGGSHDGRNPGRLHGQGQLLRGFARDHDGWHSDQLRLAPAVTAECPSR